MTLLSATRTRTGDEDGWLLRISTSAHRICHVRAENVVTTFWASEKRKYKPGRVALPAKWDWGISPMKKLVYWIYQGELWKVKKIPQVATSPLQSFFR